MKENSNTMKSTSTRRTSIAIAGSVAVGLVLSGCGSHSSTASSATKAPAASSSHGRVSGSFDPGASGSITSLATSSMVVKSSRAGTVDVDWTASTTFTRAATVTKAALTRGACVTVTGSGSTTTAAARTIAISAPVKGKCVTAIGGGGFAPGGFRPPGGTSGRTGGPPSGGPGGAPEGAGGSGPTGGHTFGSHTFGGSALMIGQVTSVSGDTLVISTTSVSGSKSTTKTVDVTLGASTTYTESKAASSTDLAVGDCVTATGTSKAKAVKAVSVRITSTGGHACTTGFARPGTGTTGG